MSELKPDKDEASTKNAGIIRSMIKHEDDLRNNRLNWMIPMHSLLFVAYAQLISGYPEFQLLIAIVGIITSISFGICFIHGNLGIKRLKCWWDEERKGKEEPPVMGLRHDEKQENMSVRVTYYLMPSQLLPWVFLAAWIVISLGELNLVNIKCLV